MRTKSSYEEIVLKELRGIPGELLPQVIQIIKLLKQTITVTQKRQNNTNIVSSGLCGAWHDDRNAEDIINDLRSNRSGFGKREISL